MMSGGRGKQFRALSPKKVSRRKRTPRCDSCGKRDGEDAGGEGQEKVRLKLCARCRAVAYCGMECQKVCGARGERESRNFPGSWWRRDALHLLFRGRKQKAGFASFFHMLTAVLRRISSEMRRVN